MLNDISAAIVSPERRIYSAYQRTKIMPLTNNPSRRHVPHSVGVLVLFIFSAGLAVAASDANAQEKNHVSTTKAKPPALPKSSAQVIVKPGMSDEEWKKAYKETGRPPFSRKSVKRTGGNVERD
ncbi:hypothetical protein [Burkholderia ubonensis]|uniref:hypothetical protein n=2 Tax=Burkholderia ubonensis TaxID=101571 RepID=UPI001E3AAEDA|nr:hypothetical protein [Burkholderia ubonensis]